MMISLFSLYLAVRPASQRMSFGWYRAGINSLLFFTLVFILSRSGRRIRFGVLDLGGNGNSRLFGD